MRLLPRSHAGQLALLLLVALVIAQGVAFVLFAGERARAARFAYQENILARTATLARLLEDTPAASQRRILDAASTRVVRFSRDAEPVAGEGGARIEAYLTRELAEALELAPGDVRASVERDEASGPRWRFLWDGDGRGRFREHARERGGPRWRPVTWIHASIRLPEGDWLNVVAGPPPGPPPLGAPFVVSLLLSLVATGAVALLVGRRIARPLKSLAESTEAYGRGEAADPVPERGPDEVRRSARAFNEMRQRLDRFVSDRMAMLAAVSHDLRTPITSLRLRAEMVEDEETREKLVETIEEMQAMTEGALAFLRADAAREETRATDLGALAESVVDDLTEIGMDTEMREGASPVVRCRAGEIRRALRNVVENAVRYAGSATVRIETAPGEAIIVVEDDGPGIAAADLARVFEPFVRLDASRSRETGGVGLGLAIARTVMRRHGGDVTLANRPGGGLRATLSMPAGDVE